MPNWATLASRMSEGLAGFLTGSREREEKLRAERLAALKTGLELGSLGTDLTGQADLFLSPDNAEAAGAFNMATRAGLSRFDRAQAAEAAKLALEQRKVAQGDEQLVLTGRNLDQQQAYRMGSLAHQAAVLDETRRYHEGALGNQAAQIAQTGAYQRGVLDNQAATLAETKRYHTEGLDMRALEVALNYARGVDVADISANKAMSPTAQLAAQKAAMGDYASALAMFKPDAVDEKGNLKPQYLPVVNQLKQEHTAEFQRMGGKSLNAWNTAMQNVLSRFKGVRDPAAIPGTGWFGSDFAADRTPYSAQLDPAPVRLSQSIADANARLSAIADPEQRAAARNRVIAAFKQVGIPDAQLEGLIQ